MQSAYHHETATMDTTDVHGVSTWMRVSSDRVQRWTKKGNRPLIPYSWEGGRKLFRISKIEAHIRRKCFCPTSGVLSPWPEEHYNKQISYPHGMKLMWNEEFLEWAGLSKQQVDSRVRRGEFPHFQFGGIRIWDPALILEARDNRMVTPMPTFLSQKHKPHESKNKTKGTK